ncbi:SMI1/KNR4 family protein [Candidatus Uabimicrobium sp. HlEnr_7]|uniref:SMI1/KNR4 family protein n=1 Tax=Candidatus Uabimicrobium helgolandensis TaxID=3095367 RepID=UPI00355916A6
MDYKKQNRQSSASKEMLDRIEYFFETDFPKGLKEILKQNNDVTYYTSQKEIQFLSTKEIKEYYDCYLFAQYMPEAIPFAMDGFGNFIMLKKHEGTKIYGANSGNLGWEDSVIFGNSFEDFLEDSTPPYEVITSLALMPF